MTEGRYGEIWGDMGEPEPEPAPDPNPKPDTGQAASGRPASPRLGVRVRPASAGGGAIASVADAAAALRAPLPSEPGLRPGLRWQAAVHAATRVRVRVRVGVRVRVS